MVSVTLTVQGESVQEVLATCRELGESTQIDLEPNWTIENLRALSQGAREILSELAKRPDGYPMDELQNALELNDSKKIGGRLSSVGRLYKRFPNRPRLYLFQHDTFSLSAPVAELLRQL